MKLSLNAINNQNILTNVKWFYKAGFDYNRYHGWAALQGNRRTDMPKASTRLGNNFFVWHKKCAVVHINFPAV
jgi:hypothetical protein